MADSFKLWSFINSELGAALPVAGGEYAHLRRAYGPFVGFLSGWTSFTIGFSAAIAAGAMSFTAYLLQLFPLDDEGGMISTALALTLLRHALRRIALSRAKRILPLRVAGDGPG